MIQDQQGQLLRIFLRESDRADDKPMHEAVLHAARTAGIAGGTVVRGRVGYGQTSRAEQNSDLGLSNDVPLIVEIVDTADRIHAFLPELLPLTGAKIMTLENVRIVGRQLRT